MENSAVTNGFRSGSGWRWSAAAVAIGLTFLTSPASAQAKIDADADSILVGMTTYLKSLKSLSAAYDADQEIVDRQGQKLQFSASGKMAVSRGDGFLMTRQGPFADTQVSFDGKLISLYGKNLNVYAQIESPGPTIDEAVEEFRMSTGLDAPGADLLATDPYSVLTEGTTAGSLVGTAYIGGVECDHLAFRGDIVDWQIWISRGEKKLPMKYVITTKWVTGAPQYSLRLSDWSTDAVDAKTFAFVPPADAKKIERIDADQIGDITLEMAQ